MLQCLSASPLSSFQFLWLHRFVSCCQKHFELLQGMRGPKVHPRMKLVHLRVAHALSAYSAAGCCGRRLCCQAVFVVGRHCWSDPFPHPSGRSFQMQDTLLSYAHASIHNIYSLSWSFRCWLKRQCFFWAWAVLKIVAATEAFLSLIYSDNLRCLAHGLISPSADYLLLWLLGNNPCTSPVLAVILEVTFYGNSTHKPVSDHQNTCVPTCGP